jgi:hypothetical protein
MLLQQAGEHGSVVLHGRQHMVLTCKELEIEAQENVSGAASWSAPSVPMAMGAVSRSNLANKHGPAAIKSA